MFRKRKKSVRNKWDGWKKFQKYINGVAGISMSCVEIFLKINKRPGTFIPNTRVCYLNLFTAQLVYNKFIIDQNSFTGG